MISLLTSAKHFSKQVEFPAWSSRYIEKNKKNHLITEKLLFIFSLIFLSVYPAYADDTADKASVFTFTDLFSFEEPVKKGDDEKKLFLNISGGYTEKTGNTNSLSMSYGFSIEYDNFLTELSLKYSGTYGKLDETVIENRGSAIFNFDYFLFWRFKSFFYSMSDYDKITLLEHRNGTGLGAKIYIVRNSYLLIDLSGAPIYQYEKYEGQPAEKDWRWSIRGRVQIFPFSNEFSVKYYAFYIPLMKDNGNYRTIHDVSLSAKLNRALGITAGYKREYNTYDKQAFIDNPLLEKLDTTTYLQVTLSI